VLHLPQCHLGPSVFEDHAPHFGVELLVNLALVVGVEGLHELLQNVFEVVQHAA